MPLQYPDETIDFLKINNSGIFIVDLNFPEICGWETVDKVQCCSPGSAVFLISSFVTQKDLKLAQSKM